ncbi:MAG: CDP-alcohol phosphatidyltransferase family protein [Verrucomicrobiota bacterium]|nr:CDP-alcohol phosphatidyltransferase family protein [Verrucomicrobiota bacterium]
MIAIPLTLTFLRLALGPLAIVLACAHAPRMIFAPLLLAGMLSDIFDGVLARKFGVVRPWLRRFDSATDIIYYLCIFVATWLVAGAVLRASWLYLALIIGSEALCLIVSWMRFGVMPATHCYSAKIYGLALCGVFVAVLAFGAGATAFAILAIFALVANAEVIAVLLLAREAPVDVPTVFRLNRHSRIQN